MFLSRNVRHGNLPTASQVQNSTALGAGQRHKIEWVAVQDKRTCYECSEMNGMQRGLSTPFYKNGITFTDRHGGTGINCRCQEVLISR